MRSIGLFEMEYERQISHLFNEMILKSFHNTICLNARIHEINILLLGMLPRQHTLGPIPPSPPPLHQVNHPPRKLVNPAPSNNNPRNRVHQPNQQRQEAPALLTNKQQNRLDVILEEDPGHVERVLGDTVGLAGGGVLVREDEVLVVAVLLDGGWGRVRVARAFGVDGRDHREEVLEFVVVGLAGRDGFVERVENRGVVRAEGEFGDHVGEVEIWQLISFMPEADRGERGRR